MHKEEVLGNTHMTSAMFRSSQISWSTSPAESRPYEYQGEQSFKETSSETISSENLLNYGPLMGSRNGTQTQVEVIPDIERSIHETDGEDEEGGYDGSLRTGSPDNAGMKEPGESEGEEYETDTDQDDHSPSDDQTSTDQISQDSNEGSAKDTQESTDYESDEEDTSTTDEDTEEILDAIHVASALPREDTPAEAIESPINPTSPAQQPIPTQDNLERTKHGQPEHNLAEYNTQDSLGSAVDDQGNPQKSLHSPCDKLNMP
ncbi:hypothetical protein L873DRAFT_1801365 [Choiromyces venosus 120613-1]|uniref:Uncharacterized protein n=1 Tax=Choiromyces venosus 120613-1 TaxID=1336337 RepID=A0A3N4K020_9PEZI|nr:hypothetical protein L873DRAFT_1801365 [Choiromyces venosus 120613-1]